MDKKIIAIIPARGGSVGVLRKNVRLLAGKPLIAYTIEKALQSMFIDRVIVSTDDDEIATVSKQFNAEVIWRPAQISGPSSSSEEALLHSLNHLSETEAFLPEILVFLQCTSPLTATEDIDGTIKTLFDEDADTALSVTPFHYFLWKISKQGTAIGINHDKSIRQLRQKQPPQYLETGAVYVMRTKGFLEMKHRFFGKTAIFVMPPERCLEIDEPVDLELAEFLIKRMGRK